MIEVVGDLWVFNNRGHWACITTNGDINGKGRAVMGRGCAREAAIRHTKLPYQLAERLRVHGNHLHPFPEYRLLTFPVKHHWSDLADISLIERSAHELMTWIETNSQSQVVLPRPGCGNGRLSWANVGAVLAPILDDRVWIISPQP